MNIGIDIRMAGSHHGGIGRYVLELARHILEIDNVNHYTLFFNQDAEEEAGCLRAAANATLVPVNIRHYSLLEQTSFLKILNKHNLDLMHFPNFNAPILYRRPFVVTIHDMIHHKIGGAKKSHWLHFQAYKKVIQNAAARAKRIITVSEYSRKDIIKFLGQPAEKISVIYEGTNLNPDVSEAKVEIVKQKFLLSRPYFLFVGVLERKKNVINLTRAFDLFIKKFKLDTDLVIAGPVDRHYPEIRHKAMDITNRDRLVFTGYVEDADLEALYKGAYAFVSASLHEGFGLPGVEAMKFNLPLVVSNTPVFNEIYDDAAVYFNGLDINDIADKMGLVAKDRQFYEQLKLNGAARSGMFDWKKAAEETLAIYNQRPSIS